MKDHSLERLLKQSAESIAILGASSGGSQSGEAGEEGGFLDEVEDWTVVPATPSEGGGYLNLYQIHSATLESGVLEDKAVLDYLVELREQHGLRLGLSLSGVAQSETLKRAAATGVFDAVQATFNVLEQSAGDALLEAHRDYGMEVIVKEAMANGRVLSGRCGEALTTAANSRGCSPDALALALVVGQPFQPLVLSGAVTEGQIRSNTDAMALAEDISGAGEMDALLESLRMSPEDYWQERSGLTWN